MDGKTFRTCKSSEDVLNIDELGSFFKTLPQKGPVEKETKGRGKKQSKKRCTCVLFAAANGSKVCDPIIIWRSKKPRCFKKLKNIYRQNGVHYFANAKAWMTNNEIMQEVLKMLDEKIIAKGNYYQFFTTHPLIPTFFRKV